ncbi:hypothetical protein KAS08_03425, partial [Candidatus Pacearchaeota archaeon]|nr:hypothetical protein [Candidatus Pacearchaeota archaeon]
MALGINRLREKKGYTFLLTRIFAVLVLSILFVSAVNESIEYVNESLSINLSPDVSNLIIDNVCDGESLMNISRENYSVDLVDSSGEKLEFEIRVEKSSSSNSFSIASSSLPVVEIILEDSPVKGLIFDNLNLDVGGSLGIDDVSEDIEAPVGKWAEVYAIDPEDLEFDSAEVSVVATGSKLYKCKDWVFGEARCAGDWVFFMDVVPGQEYTFTLTPNDPGFGEIVAIDAVHLGEDYSFISNIYDDVAVVDGVWSEAVYEGEVVRVDFEEDLVDGNVIDVVVRSNSTLAYFEVYEAGTDNLVGRSGAVNGVELVYTMVSGLSEPTDSFDLKVVKVVYDDEDNTSSVDMSAYSFLEFDFIHDDYITSSQADGFFVYEELNIQAPRYRTWDESNAFSAELIDAGTVSGNILWTVVKGSHERDEMIVGTQDNANDVNVQVYGSSWGNLLEVSSDVVNSAYRAFDIEYEGVSGDALIVYENSSAANSVLTYRIWNGTGYSSEQTLTTLLSNAVHWVSLVSKTGTDDVMLLAHDSASSLYAVPWNGTAFDLTRDIILSSGTVSSTKQHFDFAWEGSNGDGLVSYGEGNNLAYRNYTYSSGSWGSASTIALGNGLNGVRMCSDVNSDYIGMIWVDAGADVNASMWNGATIIGGLSPDTGVEINGVNNVNVDCAWETSGEVALFGFIDRNQLSMDYFTFTKSGESWSTTSLTSTGVLANFATDDTAGLRFVENPVTDEIMVVGQDIAEDVDVVRWDGSAFQTISSSPVESATGVLNGAQESAMFDWYRYDPSPFVKDLTLVDGTVYNATDSVNITFNVTDNIEIDDVFVDVIFPNSTIVRYGVSNSSSVYNLTFSDSDLIGNYVVRVIANDTSIYQNVNSSETVSFLVAEWNKPNVSLIVPTLNSEYNISDSLEIAVDVTDDNSVDYVFANITYPNSTIVSLELSYSFGDKYNSSFVVPALLGDYDIVFVANDSSGNINSSVESNFSVSDVVAPVVLDLGCNPSSLNLSQNVICNISVTDDVSIDIVFANITYPNSTVVFMEVNNVTDNYYFSFSGTSLTGQYNVSWFANDSSGNVGVNSSSFIVSDVVVPEVSGIVPTLNSEYNISDVIEIAVDVMDDLEVDYVFANLTLPNLTSVILPLSFASGDKYNSSFVVPALLGNYDIVFIANDSSGNINSSVESNFSVSDVVAPVVLDLECNPSSLNLSQNVICNVSATDDVSIDTVLANITYSNGTSVTVAVSNVTDNYYFSFALTSLIGQYNVSWFANDSSGNVGENSSYFIVSDVIVPVVSSVLPTLNSEYNISDSFEIAVDVTDDLEVDYVFANLTLPNLTSVILPLSFVSGNKYNSSFVVSALLGDYDIVFVANDSSGNVNSSVESNFSVSDVVAPRVDILDPSIGSNFLQNDDVLLSVDVMDDMNVSYVYINMTYPNLTVINIPLTDDNFDEIYNITFNDTNKTGTYDISVFANDSSGNINATEVRSFNIQESDAPLVSLIGPANNARLNSNDVTLVCDSTDAGGLANVTLYHNIGQAFGANETRDISGSSNSSNFTINDVSDGTYIWNCITRDTFSNEAFGIVNFTFTVDTVLPVVSSVSPSVGSVYNISNVVEISADVTDDESVDEVFANITFPNSTVVQLSLTYSSGNKYNNSFIASVLLGVYDVLIIANDSSGNINATEVGGFNVTDVVVPIVLDLECNPSSLNLSQNVICNVSVTDDVSIDTVLANVTYSNGTSVTVAVSNVTDNYYFSFALTSLTGQYNVSWFANDSSGNVGANSSSFVVSDVVVPVVSSVLPTLNSEYNISDSFEIAVDVTDDLEVDYVFANLTLPNLTSVILPLSFASGNKYNSSFVVPALLGDYDIVFVANDSSGNINSSVESNFSVSDVVAPLIEFTLPVSNSVYNISNVVEIAVDVTDDLEVDYVFANLTLPNLTSVILPLSFSSGDKYNSSFVVPALLGDYDIVFVANDSSGNINSSVESNFSVSDVVAPVVLDLECNPSSLNLSQNVICNVSVTDDVSIDTVLANVTYSNGTSVTVAVSNVTDNYYFSFALTSLTGQYNVSWFANDSSGNVGENSSYFIVSDVVVPVVSSVLPIDG